MRWSAIYGHGGRAINVVQYGSVIHAEVGRLRIDLSVPDSASKRGVIVCEADKHFFANNAHVLHRVLS